MKAYDFHGKRNICGDRIREARLRARLSQSDLCRRLQLAGVIVERDVISRIEFQPTRPLRGATAKMHKTSSAFLQ